MAKTFEEIIAKFNPYHAKDGKFTTSGGAAFFTIRTKDPSKQKWADMAVVRAKLADAEANKKKGVDGCASVKEVQEMMDKNGWFRTGGIRTTQLDGVDLEAAKEIYRAYDDVYNKYPQLKGAFAPPVAQSLGSNVYAQCALVSGRVEVNTKHYGDSKKLAQRYERDVQNGFHPQGTNWKSIVSHEIGHAIDGAISGQGVNGYSLYDTYRSKANPLSKQLRREVCKETKTYIKDTSKNVSGYASKDHFEWFAEGFAEYMTSPSPRPVAAALGKRLDGIISDIKVEDNGRLTWIGKELLLLSRERPKFFDSEWFVAEPDNWHLKEGAPEEIVREFEEYMKEEDGDEYILR